MYNCEDNYYISNNQYDNHNPNDSNFYFQIKYNNNNNNNDLNNDDNKISQWFLMNNNLLNINFGGCITGNNDFSLNLIDGSYTLYSTTQVIWSICDIIFESAQEIHFTFYDNECIIQKIKHNNNKLVSNDLLTFYTTFEGLLSIDSIHDTFSISELSNYISSIYSDILIEFFPSNNFIHSYNIIIQYIESITSTLSSLETVTRENYIFLSTASKKIKSIEDEIFQYFISNKYLTKSNIHIHFKIYSITFEENQIEQHRRNLQQIFVGI